MKSLLLAILLIILGAPAYGNGIAFDSTSLDFGSVALTNIKDLTLNLQDTTDADLEVDTIVIGGVNAGDFTVVAPINFPIVLKAHDSVPTLIIIRFSPGATGSRTALLDVYTTNGPHAIPMKGSGVASVRIVFDSTSLDFGSLALKDTKDLTVQVENITDSDLQLNGITIGGVDASDFTLVTPTLFPVVLQAHTLPTSIIVEFSPQVLGPRTALIETQTSDGPFAIPMKGVGTGESSSISLSTSSIDFGNIAPNGFLYDTIELYSNGPDSATITDIEVSNSGNQVAFEAGLVNQSLSFPFKLAKGDSVAIAIQFSGMVPLGEKDGQLIVYGGTTTAPSCSLTGFVEYGIISLAPTYIDFGTMYAGEVRDTTVRLSNIGDVDITIDDIEPLFGDFTFVNSPTVPVSVPAGGFYDFIIRANPAVLDTPTVYGQLLMISRTAIPPGFEEANFIATVLPMPLATPDTQTGYYGCVATATVNIAVPVTDTGSRSYTITNVRTNDTNVSIVSGLFPVTISSGAAVSVPISFSVTNPAATSQAVLQFYGGEQFIFADTIFLVEQPSTAAVQLTASAITNTTRVGLIASSTNTIGQFGLHTIILHLRSANEDVADIDPATITLDSSFSSDSITITPVSGGYDVTITSSTSLDVASGASLLSFDLQRFVSKADSTLVSITVDAPEEAGCLMWTGDSVSVSASDICGSSLIENMLKGEPLIQSIALKNNPVEGSMAQVRIVASAEAACTGELYSPIGRQLFINSFHLTSGPNEISIPMNSLASGPYYLRVASSTGEIHSLRFVKLQ